MNTLQQRLAAVRRLAQVELGDAHKLQNYVASLSTDERLELVKLAPGIRDELDGLRSILGHILYAVETLERKAHRSDPIRFSAAIVARLNKRARVEPEPGLDVKTPTHLQ